MSVISTGAVGVRAGGESEREGSRKFPDDTLDAAFAADAVVAALTDPLFAAQMRPVPDLCEDVESGVGVFGAVAVSQPLMFGSGEVLWWEAGEVPCDQFRDDPLGWRHVQALDELAHRCRDGLALFHQATVISDLGHAITCPR